MKLDNLLWSTRGKNWGYRILLNPQKPHEDWLSLHNEMFKETIALENTYFRRGQLRLSNTFSLPYTALIFQDPESRVDRAGRIILHEVALLGEDSQEIKDSADVDKIWDLISDIYRDLYSLESEEIRTKKVVFAHGHLNIIEQEYQEEENSKKKKPDFSIAAVIIIVVIIAAIVLAFSLLSESD